MHTDWLAALPELLMDCGAYQYHMDPSKTIDARYEAGPYLLKPTKCAESIVLMNDRSVPVSPALCMNSNLNGTHFPATDSWNGLKPYRLKNETNLKENFPAKYEKDEDGNPTGKLTDEYRNLYFNVASPTTAPIFGEFNNMKPLMYIDFDPNVKADQRGVIYISVTYTDTPQDLRHVDARHTAYDSKADSSWHYTHGIASFDILRIVKTAVVPFAVKSIDELNLFDDQNEPITQEWFIDMMDWLNGKNTFEGISARNTSKYIAQRQNRITEMDERSGGK